MHAAKHKITSTGKDRIGALDSVRGFASLAVLLGHSLAVCEWDRSISGFPLLHSAFDGRSAVTMFFVLSGFVLSLRYFQDPARRLQLIPFYVRRLTRIWIPWFLFFLISLGAAAIRPANPETHPELSEHQLMFWSTPCTVGDLALQLVFQLHDATKMLLPQDWSLGVELRASLFIPFLIFLCRFHWVLVLGIGLTVWTFKPSGGYYYASFSIGVVTALIHTQLPRIADRRLGFALVFFGGLFYQIRWVYEKTGWLSSSVGERDVWVVSSFGCALVILGIIRAGRIRCFFEAPLPTYLGRISYSLYLVQVVVLVCLGPWVVRCLNIAGMGSECSLLAPLFVVLMVAICVPLAAVGERFIEIPSILLGRKATRILQRGRLGDLGF